MVVRQHLLHLVSEVCGALFTIYSCNNSRCHSLANSITLYVKYNQVSSDGCNNVSRHSINLIKKIKKIKEHLATNFSDLEIELRFLHHEILTVARTSTSFPLPSVSLYITFILY